MTGKKCNASVRCQNRAGKGKRGMCNKHHTAWTAVNRPVDSEIVREHIARLRAAGMGYRQIAKLAGIGQSTVWDVVHRRSTTYAPTARAIMAVNPDADRGAVMSPVGAGRRVRALIAVGYTETQVAAATQVRECNLWRYERDKAGWIRPETHDRIDAAFQTLSVQPPPTGWVADRARRRAARYGWLPALAWDLETIDDPAAEPIVDAIRRPPKLGGILEDFRIEYLELRDELRLSDAEIAERMGITDDLLGKRLSRLKIPTQQSRAAS